MQIQSSDNSQEKDCSQSLKIEKENISCEDGFCSLQNNEGNPSIQKNKINLFDPI